MNLADRLSISVNLVKLIKCLNLDSIMPHLINVKIFTATMLEDIYEEKGMHRKRKLLLELFTRGPHAYDRFLKCLEDTGQHDAVEILNQGRLKSNDIISFRKPEIEMQLNLEILNESENEAYDYVFKVNFATSLKQGPNIYRMTSSNRGLCLIINNVNFLDQKLERIASDYDAMKVDSLFTRFGYEVCRRRNLKANQMLEMLSEFSKAFQNKDFESCVVIILSHGDCGVIFGTDQEPVLLRDIYAQFDNYNCPTMKEKPKMFFIQACQGKKPDIGVSTLYESIDSTPEGPSFNNQSVQILPTCSDMLIAQSTVEGNVSIRDHTFGSWFFYHLVHIFSQNAHNTELIAMLRLVDKLVKQMTSVDGEKQATQVISKGWDKELYFNPGLWLN